ncbi:hypothetical protein CK203_030598 [Vitis vinifera]|uniref:Uncharacterized protein n=1 Tax=Vitis vinifera TaxID=29760 RepID=A0A438JDP8_VITVI|nr:hypothetical protein CK203_030598 [Vitis vinifera]
MDQLKKFYAWDHGRMMGGHHFERYIGSGGLGSLSAKCSGSLSTSPFPSYSGLLRPIIIGDVDQPPFLEDIEESHNAFSIQPPLQGSRSKTNNVESWDYRGHLYLLL